VKPSTPFYSESWLTSSSSLRFCWASAFSYMQGNGEGEEVTVKEK